MFSFNAVSLEKEKKNKERVAERERGRRRDEERYQSSAGAVRAGPGEAKSLNSFQVSQVYRKNLRIGTFHLLTPRCVSGKQD